LDHLLLGGVWESTLPSNQQAPFLATLGHGAKTSLIGVLVMAYAGGWMVPQKIRARKKSS
jgi:hypothetical protein